MVTRLVFQLFHVTRTSPVRPVSDSFTPRGSFTFAKAGAETCASAVRPFELEADRYTNDPGWRRFNNRKLCAPRGW
jgi:hypothetical protein